MRDTPNMADWRDLPLAGNGRSLIEASAGTGKTWTIAVLYLRLLLEDDKLAPRKIIVATFTNAAASELRERLRGRLLWAEAIAQTALTGQLPSSEALPPDEAWLRGRWQSGQATAAADLARLRLALGELDMAPICTLHSLAARILSNHPLAVSGGFEQGSLVDGKALASEVYLDLLRSLQQGDAADRERIVPAVWQSWLPDKLSMGDIEKCLLPATDVPLPAFPEWPSVDELDVLRNAVQAKLFRANSVLPKAWQGLIDAVGQTPPQLPDDKTLEQMAIKAGPKGVLKGNEDSPLLQEAMAVSRQLAERLGALRDAGQQQVWWHLRQWAQAHKAMLCERRGERSFDDLPESVMSALIREAGQIERPLADALHADWPVALVDEFQDTDGLQYGILDAIYRAHDGSPRGRLLMIGDPKQAIYRFRGGDIHTYQRAASSVPPEGRMTLAVNRRSSHAFVQACNNLFAEAGSALDARAGASGIHYQPVESAVSADEAVYRIGTVAVDRPLVIHLHPCDGDGMSKAAKETAALQACAEEISHILGDNGHRLGGAAVAPKNIAVLLPSHRQLVAMRALLAERGIASVSRGRESVLQTQTARDLCIILYAVLHAERLPALRAALVSPLWGMSLEDLHALENDDLALQKILSLFHAWRTLWQRQGVLAVTEALLDVRGEALLAAAQGERTVTDLRHLGEILQAEAGEGRGEHALLAWLAAQMQADESEDETQQQERQLRIESEASRVQLMTLHTSKGLEFDLVFLPLMWAHTGQSKKELAVLSDADTGKRLLRVDGKAARQVAEELQDERFRLLYVALTRAAHACHVYMPLPEPAAASANSDETGVPSSSGKPDGSALEILLTRIPMPLDSSELAERTPHIEWRYGWRAMDSAPPPRPVTVLPALVSPPLWIPPPWQPLPGRHSFSTLVAGALHDGSQAAAASDEIDGIIEYGEDDLAHPQLLKLKHHAGAAFGNAVHAIFEHRRIGQPLSAQLEHVCKVLQREYPDARTADGLAMLLAERLDEVLTTPLAKDMPALAELQACDMKAEMAFHFSLPGVRLQRLREICHAHGETHLIPEGNRILRGLMTGKIDLIFRHAGCFHVLDYKSNLLGSRLLDYQPAALQREMDKAHYRLQALLYSVALDRYLAERQPGYQRAQHLGKAWYLFVRAVGLADGAGIWQHRFPDALLADVQAVLSEAFEMEMQG